MHIITKEGKKLINYYTSHDCFLEDIDVYIAENHHFSFLDYTEGLLDLVSGHLLYWCFKNYSEDEKAKHIYEELIKKNAILSRLTKDGDPNPESTIYEFGGKSLYYDVREEDLSYSENYEEYYAKLEDDAILHLSPEEFEDLGGELSESYNEEKDEDYMAIEFSWKSGNVYFFMSKEQNQEMHDYLLKCVNELNVIYASLNMKVIG
jgi:hypothetical protein